MSLFIRWHNLYNALTDAQKLNWTEIWEDTAFGDHGGANGWPGSGFSAFIWINAARRRLRFDPYLEPPVAGLFAWGAGIYDSTTGAEDVFNLPTFWEYTFVATAGDAANPYFGFATNDDPMFIGKVNLKWHVGALRFELLTNPDFSDGMTGWTIFGNAHATLGGCVMNRSTFIQQTVAIVEGDTYTLTFYLQQSPAVF